MLLEFGHGPSLVQENEQIEQQCILSSANLDFYQLQAGHSFCSIRHGIACNEAFGNVVIILLS